MTRLIYYVQSKEGVLDARCVTMATRQSLYNWFNTPNHVLVRGSGVPYTVYTRQIEDNVYPQDSLFYMNVDDYMIVDDEPALKDLIEEAWNTISTGTQLH